LIEVVLRPEAEADLLEIALYIAQDSPERAEKLIAKLRRRVRFLQTLPLAGRPRPELGEGLRSLVERPHVILYRLIDDAVEIVAFLHGARDIQAALADRSHRDEA
jgi:toxin ParE1/3/4